MTITVSEVAPDDDAGLDELLAFAALHGRPRAATGAAYRELLRNDVVAWQAFIARDDDLRAAALATISPAIGLDQVQLNAFTIPGDQDAFDHVLAAVDAWGRARGGTHVTAHVSAPSEAQLHHWHEAGFEQVGERSRVVRPVTPQDADGEQGRIDGARIVALADHPELEESAEQLWKVAHEDVPSALRFDSADLPPLRHELAIGAGEPFPWSTLVAADGERVVGLVVALTRSDDRPTVLGHRMTATARDWRGRGVALALKLELIRRAARAGVTLLEASNDAGNEPMQAINDRLGYHLDYRLVLLRRPIGS